MRENAGLWIKSHGLRPVIHPIFFTSMPAAGRRKELRGQTPLFASPVTSEHGMLEHDPAYDERTLQARQIVNEIVKALAGPNFTASADVHGGDPAGIICEVGKGYDLIVVSSHGRKGVRRFLLGSVSEDSVHLADRSVFVVR